MKLNADVYLHLPNSASVSIFKKTNYLEFGNGLLGHFWLFAGGLWSIVVVRWWFVVACVGFWWFVVVACFSNYDFKERLRVTASDFRRFIFFVRNHFLIIFLLKGLSKSLLVFYYYFFFGIFIVHRKKKHFFNLLQSLLSSSSNSVIFNRVYQMCAVSWNKRAVFNISHKKSLVAVSKPCFFQTIINWY